MFRRRLRASVGFYGANLIGRMAQSQAVTRDLASTLLRPGSKLGAMLRQPAARVLFVSIVLAALAAQAAPALTGNELGLIINDADPLSVLIGEYYARKRQIPAQNILRIRITNTGAVLRAEEFAVLKADIDARTPKTVQAYALTWVTPD